MQTNPEQWAVELAEDWDIECRRCSEYEGDWKADFALAIQAAFAEHEARFVGAITSTNAMACTPDGDGSHKITLHYPDTGTAMAAFVQFSDVADSAALKDRTHG